MATVVSFHAHPDDECIVSGGTLAAAHAAGHRTVLVVATRGELGEVAPDVLAPGETLGERRTGELLEAARVLGIDRVEFLGYTDSGVVGDEGNDAPGSFWSAEVDEAAARLSAILDEERPQVLTVYDDHGGYGHPDHIQVHRVGHLAARRSGVPRVLEVTMNRDHIRNLIEAQAAEAVGEVANELPVEDPGATLDVPDVDGDEPFGSPEEIITHAVDVSDWLAAKRDAMRAHASQIPEDSWFLQLSDEEFAAAFGTEWYIDPAAPRAEGAPFLDSIWR
jgi:LmbE family N-acetylglucosaminyl deacetylase